MAEYIESYILEWDQQTRGFYLWTDMNDNLGRALADIQGVNGIMPVLGDQFHIIVSPRCSVRDLKDEIREVLDGKEETIV